MAKEIINEDFDLPAHFKEADDDDGGVEIEIVDDTPEEDRGRPSLSAKETEEQEDELEHYSDKVQKRINQLNHRMHDERRAKETLERQNAEAIRIAQSILEENQRLHQTLNYGQQEFTKEAFSKMEYQEKLAEDKYRKAYESGDTEGTLSAQKEISELVVQKSRLHDSVQNFVHQNTTPLQTPQQPVYNQPQPEYKAPAPRDPRAEDWATRNPWFGKDEEMTSLAYGLHQRLVNEGFDPTSDEYYHAIDGGIQKRFPEKFNRPKKSSPVAPAGRTAASKKVTLTASQVAIAKRLGVPLEVYAKHASKGATING